MSLFANFHALLVEFSFFLFAAAALAAAIAAWFYLPLFGRPVAAGLAALAVAFLAYDAGYAARGKLDRSGALAAQLAEEKRQTEAAQKIAGEAALRQRLADSRAAQLDERIAAYEQQLAAQQMAPAPSLADPAKTKIVLRKIGGCGLSRADVRFLRGLVAGAPAPAGRAR